VKHGIAIAGLGLIAAAWIGRLPSAVAQVATPPTNEFTRTYDRQLKLSAPPAAFGGPQTAGRERTVAETLKIEETSQTAEIGDVPPVFISTAPPMYGPRVRGGADKDKKQDESRRERNWLVNSALGLKTGKNGERKSSNWGWLADDVSQRQTDKRKADGKAKGESSNYNNDDEEESADAADDAESKEDTAKTEEERLLEATGYQPVTVGLRLSVQRGPPAPGETRTQEASVARKDEAGPALKDSKTAAPAAEGVRPGAERRELPPVIANDNWRQAGPAQSGRDTAGLPPRESDLTRLAKPAQEVLKVDVANVTIQRADFSVNAPGSAFKAPAPENRPSFGQSFSPAGGLGSDYRPAGSDFGSSFSITPAGQSYTPPAVLPASAPDSGLQPYKSALPGGSAAPATPWSSKFR